MKKLTIYLIMLILLAGCANSDEINWAMVEAEMAQKPLLILG